MIRHIQFQLPVVTRGYHLITDIVKSKLGELPKNGVLNLFIRHTSAALTINEDADPSVRDDFESFLNYIVPENMSFLTHTLEGPDDMPAHIKASLMGVSVLIPITNGELNMGIWQGIYLCEHRDNGGPRKLVLTAYGS